MSHCWGTVILQTASYSTSVILTLHFFCFSYKSLEKKISHFGTDKALIQRKGRMMGFKAKAMAQSK